MAEKNNMKGQQNIISIAEFLHSNYEFFAHKTGWQTQEKCQVDFWELPPANIKTMLYLAEHLEGVFNIDFETLAITQPRRRGSDN